MNKKLSKMYANEIKYTKDFGEQFSILWKSNYRKSIEWNKTGLFTKI